MILIDTSVWIDYFNGIVNKNTDKFTSDTIIGLDKIETIETAEAVVVKKAVRPIRNILKIIFKIIWTIIKAVVKLLSRMGKK